LCGSGLIIDDFVSNVYGIIMLSLSVKIMGIVVLLKICSGNSTSVFSPALISVFFAQRFIFKRSSFLKFEKSIGVPKDQNDNKKVK
jgi:hypothetical protein